MKTIQELYNEIMASKELKAQFPGSQSERGRAPVL